MFFLKWKAIEFGLPTTLFDAVVFNKIKAQTGGNIKMMITGGAPLPKETQYSLVLV
jgi:long-chain acyl-CoA synthetase